MSNNEQHVDAVAMLDKLIEHNDEMLAFAPTVKHRTAIIKNILALERHCARRIAEKCDLQNRNINAQAKIIALQEQTLSKFGVDGFKFSTH